MSYLVRWTVDLLLPESINATQLDEVRKSIIQHTGAIAGFNTFNKTITETKAGGPKWHLHDGVTGCSDCAANAHDERNANTVEAQ